MTMMDYLKYAQDAAVFIHGADLARVEQKFQHPEPRGEKFRALNNELKNGMDQFHGFVVGGKELYTIEHENGFGGLEFDLRHWGLGKVASVGSGIRTRDERKKDAHGYPVDGDHRLFHEVVPYYADYETEDRRLEFLPDADAALKRISLKVAAMIRREDMP